MARTGIGTKSKTLDLLLDEASRRILRAMTLAPTEAKAEWPLAAECEEQVACFMVAQGRDMEAASHYFRAASCRARVREYFQAVPLLRAAMSFSLTKATRFEAERLLKDWLRKGKSQLLRQYRKQSATVS